MFESGYVEVGRLRGAPILMHVSVPLLALAYSGRSSSPLVGIALVLLVLLHEVGHALMAHRVGCEVVQIRILPFGGRCEWIGFPTPLLWGALAFALNYIPYAGPGLMHLILFVIGLLTFDTLLPALIAPLFFMAFTFVEGHFIVPNVVGRQLLLHPLAVFLSLAFWAWLWGPLGAFLATPFLIVSLVVIGHLFPREDNGALPG